MQPAQRERGPEGSKPTRDAESATVGGSVAGKSSGPSELSLPHIPAEWGVFSPEILGVVTAPPGGGPSFE
jgi:hypothetical protein